MRHHKSHPILLVLFLLWSGMCLAQNEVGVRLYKVDSLLGLENYESADSLLKIIEKSPPKLIDEKLRLQYLRGFYYSLLNDNTRAYQYFVNIPNEAQKIGNIKLAAESNIQMALTAEKSLNFEECNNYLEKALAQIKSKALDSLYSWYYIRKSSYYQVQKLLDSAKVYANEAIASSIKYKDQKSLSDAYLLMGLINIRTNPKLALQYFKMQQQTIGEKITKNNECNLYHNFAGCYLFMCQYEKALKYSDTSVHKGLVCNISNMYSFYFAKHKIFLGMKNLDSSLYYYDLFATHYLNFVKKKEAKDIEGITQKFSAEQKQAVIQKRKHQLIVAIMISMAILLATAILFLQNKKIKKQNKKINDQLLEVNKLVKQKQILLSELQHRVKNNLQHILGLMSLQKESLENSTIEEVILENQNRVMSLALLHKKLSGSDKTDSVAFDEYLKELTNHIIEAYQSPDKKISAEIGCEVREMQMEIAIPLGLMVVEMLSNSFKHAFPGYKTGTIKIAVANQPGTGKRLLTYCDNGIGFDYQKQQRTGIGLELIEGLRKEINGTLVSKAENGTYYSISF